MDDAQADKINDADTQLAKAELTRLTKENDLLRHLLAKSNADCPYCGLPANDIAKCVSGFPGCARADDLMTGGDPCPSATS